MDAPKSVGEVIGTVINIRAGRPSEPGRVHSRFALRQSSGLAAAEYGLSSAAAPAGLELFESIAFNLIDQFPSAISHDPPVLKDMNLVWLDIFQKLLVMSDNYS